MGLGALYLLHILAQDYMKIRKPAAKLAKFLLTKREVSNNEDIEKFQIDWDRILTYDKPLGCAQLLICQIEAGVSFPIEKDNEDVIIISYLVE